MCQHSHILKNEFLKSIWLSVRLSVKAFNLNKKRVKSLAKAPTRRAHKLTPLFASTASGR